MLLFVIFPVEEEGTKRIVDPSHLLDDVAFSSYVFNKDHKTVSVLFEGNNLSKVIQTLGPQPGKVSQQSSIVRTELDEQGTVLSTDIKFIGGCEIQITNEPDSLVAKYEEELEGRQ